jgi:FtsH-binding integral membrane protein
VGEELHPERNEEASQDWRAGNAFVYLLFAGSLATFAVSYWRLHFELLHSVEAAVMALPIVASVLVPFIWMSQFTEHKGYDPKSAAILTALSTTPFLTFLFIVLFAISAPIWVCFIAPAIVGLALSVMYKSAKRPRLTEG